MSQIALTEAAGRAAAVAACLYLCPLALGLTASAQETIPSFNHKQPSLERLFQPPQRAVAGLNGIRDSGRTQGASAKSQSDKEVVLHHFQSPPHGAYPANGVIRDWEGNLYGTTNGSYSDIGGGGTHDAGVVFKIDPAGQETVLYSFTGSVDGSAPNAVIRDSAGNLYGTTSAGGTASAGVVFEVDTAGNETVLYSFTGGADGANPNSLVRDRKGNLYGTTSGGGPAGYGVVFKIDGSGNEAVLHAFTGGADGAYPNAYVALDPLGNFYGATNGGGNKVGSAGGGVVFKVDQAGHEAVLYTFTGGNDGAQPNGVMRDREGELYGTASDGGASGAGVVFRIDAMGHETVLYSFTGGDDGGSSDAGVVRDREGNVFGTTNGGGTAGEGVVFKVDKAGHETVLHTFTRGPEGDQPYSAGVILDADGNLYGTTSFNAAGGQGAVYKLDRSGAATVVYAFPGVAGGQYPYNGGISLGADGRLYGVTQYGGRGGAGVLYELGEHSQERVLYTFDLFTAQGYGQPTGDVTRDSAGNFYGTTFIGQSYAGFGYGVVYRVDSAGHSSVLHNFTGGADGGDPYGGVILDPKGNLYGTASGGGASNNGAVFKIDPAGNETVLYSFTGGADGGSPLGSIIRDEAGNLYGAAELGGASNAGVVFKIDAAGHETVIYTFSGGDDGGYPLGGPIRDAAGNLYGTTNGGGPASAGVVYKIDPSGHETVLYSFTGGDDGGYPLWVTPARDAQGNLYGTTGGGGTANAGVAFKLDPSGHETVLHNFTGGDDGGNPYVGVTLGPEGQLYGTTAFGGRADIGVVFEIEP